MMNQQYLQAVEHAFVAVLNSMGGINATAGTPYEKQSNSVLVDDSITAVISLSSDEIHFSVALIFPKRVVVAIAQRMLQGMDIDENNPMVADLAGEVANMVVGGAKNSLDKSGNKLSLSLPVVVAGHDYHIEHKTDSQVWLVPFDSELGQIYVEASYCFRGGAEVNS